MTHSGWAVATWLACATGPPEPVATPHFPDRLHAVVWRNWGLVEPERLGSALGATADQVRAIRNLVASSVPNLKPDRVTVADETNRTLAAGSEETGFTSATADAAKASTEAQMQARIKDIVEGVVGAGAARVQVTADIDHSRSTTQEQKFAFDSDGPVGGPVADLRSPIDEADEELRQRHGRTEPEEDER